MKATKIFAAWSGILLACLMLVSQAAYAGVAGYAQFVNGSVQIESLAGQMRTLQKGGAVNEGDTVISAQAASAQIRMQDGGFIAVRPDTRLKFDRFIFSGKDDGSERSFFSLFKGGFRAVTGLIGRLNKSNYRITTASSTIGIRGTDHETFVVTPDSPLAKVTPVGTYNKVNVGETSITTDKGTIFVLPNQMGFAGAKNQMPELKPLNTNIFTAVDRPTKEAKVDKKEVREEAKEVRVIATVDNTAQAVAAAPAAEVASSSTGSGVDKNIVQPITATSGTTDINLSGGGPSYAAQAQAAADAANVAKLAAVAAELSAATADTQLAALTLVATTPATTAIGTAGNTIATATPLVTSATALTPANATTATGNATSAQTAAATSASQAAAAQAVFTANGTFADSLAAPANSLTTSANTSVQSANTSVQTAAGAVTAQNTALTAAQTAASAALAAANTNLTAANNSLSTANNNNTAISTAQSAVTGLAAQAQTAVTAAQTAATAAQTAATQAATLQAAGDLTGAAAQLTIAQQQQTIAQQQQAVAQSASTTLANQLSTATTAHATATTAVTTAVASANSAATSAGMGTTGAQNYASAAQTANTTASSALATTTSQLAVVTSNAATVATQAPIAAYNNPAVASINFLGHLAMPVPVVTGVSYNVGHELNNAPQANTTFVLDGNGNLVEMRNTSFQIQPVQSTPATSIANADVTWSGGTAADTFKLADKSIYAGRWSGATVTVTDKATVSAIAPFTLTPANSLWTVLLTPNSGYVQSLTGTTSYSMAGATKPFDAAGITGTLNSAILSADFTAQLVNATLNLTMPSGLMAGTYAVTASNMPINTAVSGDSSGFGGNTTPTVSCSGGTGTCAGGGYSANVGGSFAGTAAASAGLGYDIWPTVSTGSPVTDLVQGLVAFSTTTPPTVAPFAPYASNYIAVETAGAAGGFNFNSDMMAAPADLVYVTGTAGGASTSGALQSATFHDIGGGGNWTQTSAISGGTATSANAMAFATTGIQYGAWTGYTGQSTTWSQSLGGKNGGAPNSWMYGPEGYVDASNGWLFAGTSAGTFSYQMDGATAPKSKNTGLTGVLNSATFTVNFASMMLTANMSLTMPGNENWGVATPVGGILIGFGSALNVNKPVVTYGVGVPATTCLTCFGNVSGMFTGQNFAGAILSYDLYNNAAMGGGDVSGNVALTRVGVSGNTAVIDGAPAPTGNIVVATAGNGSGSQNVSTYSSSTTNPTNGLLTAYGSSSTGTGSSSSYSTTVTCTTCTTYPSGQVGTSGIYYGTWDAGTYTSSYSVSIPTGMPLPTYWITGPEAGPLYLTQALTSTATYTFNAGQVSNLTGAGTVANTTALTLDFSKQTVGINLDVTINDMLGAPHNWNAATLPGDEAVLGNGQGINGAAFKASANNNGGGSGLLTVTVDAGATPVTINNANINGQLTGTGLTGAIISFNLDGVLNPGVAQTSEIINGVAAFTGPAQAVATPNQYVSMSLADPFSPVPLPVLGFYANAPSRVTTDASGNLTQFDIQTINGGGGSSTVTNASPTNVADHGTDPVSGISWGRWAGGTFNVTDRATGAVTPVTQTGSLHWITEPVSTSAVTLPTSGTYIYTNAGGTLPTDSSGNVGTAPATASLTANFTAQTVNLGVSATVAGTTLNATGTSVPIIQNTVFYASSLEPATSTSHLAVTCTGTCGAALGGVVIGKFTGAGAIGAAMSYGLQNGATTISGVTAFHR